MFKVVEDLRKSNEATNKSLRFRFVYIKQCKQANYNQQLKTESAMGYNGRIVIMKKYICMLYIMLLTHGALAVTTYDRNNISGKYHREYVDVISAYQYDGLFKYSRFIPLFKPSSVKSNSLTINLYDVATYFGENVKATEYPKKTYKADYNNNGHLYRIEDGDEWYYLKYSWYDILSGYECYNKNTGQLIREEHLPNFCKDEFSSADTTSCPSWLLINRRSYEPDLGSYCVSFGGAFKKNKRGEKMVVRESRFWVKRSKSWLRNRLGSNWKKMRNGIIDKEMLMDINLEFWDGYGSVGIYNEVGIKNFTLEECLSHAILNGEWYEYIW